MSEETDRSRWSRGRASIGRRRSLSRARRALPYARPSRRRSRGDESTCGLDPVKLYFQYVTKNPALELELLRLMTAPLVGSTRVGLPCYLGTVTPDCCLRFSKMGQFSVVDVTCEICAGGRRVTPRLDEPALILAYMHQIRHMVDNKEFYNSLLNYAAFSGLDPKTVFAQVLRRRTLFFVYYMFQRYTEDFYVLFRGFSGLHLVFKNEAVHLASDFLRQLAQNTVGYVCVADVWDKRFVISIGPSDASDDPPGPEEEESQEGNVPDAADIYCKSQDLAYLDEVSNEYQKMYKAFDKFAPSFHSRGFRA